MMEGVDSKAAIEGGKEEYEKWVPARWWWQRVLQERDMLAEVARCRPIVVTPASWSDENVYRVDTPWGKVAVWRSAAYSQGPWAYEEGLPTYVRQRLIYSLWEKLSNPSLTVNKLKSVGCNSAVAVSTTSYNQE